MAEASYVAHGYPAERCWDFLLYNLLPLAHHPHLGSRCARGAEAVGKKELPPFAEFFGDVEDPRRQNANQRHELIELIVMAVIGTICGADSWKEIEVVAQAKEKWLRTFMKLPGGIPSHDTFGRVFRAIDPVQFRAAFGNYIADVASSVTRERIAIDGKTARRSFDGRGVHAPIHTVSAWAGRNRVVLGQVRSDEASNEITAIPVLLQALSLKDVIVTIDAMGCQREIADEIVAGGGDYVLTLKSNQPSLLNDAQHLYQASLMSGLAEGVWSTYETEDHNHGRHEMRRHYVTQVLDDLETRSEWRGLRSLCVVERERTLNNLTTTARHYYISSLSYQAKTFAEIIRGHWGIENSLHWVLDMAFREDESRVRKGNAAENLVVMRHLALNLLRRSERYDIGIKGRRLAAAVDHEYLLEVIMGMAS